MGSNPPLDPLVCCAARVCCGGLKARKATEKLLKSMGLDDTHAKLVSDQMEAKDIVFMPRTVSVALRDMISSSHEYQQEQGESGLEV